MRAVVSSTDAISAALHRRWAQLLTVVHTSWLRRDMMWALLPALLAAAVHPH